MYFFYLFIIIIIILLIIPSGNKDSFVVNTVKTKVLTNTEGLSKYLIL
jgi:hypothetical protein